MNAFDFLQTAWEREGLGFLIIGAHALSHYGVVRETADLDLLIAREDLNSWEEYLLGGGYTCFNRAQNFAQYNPPADSSWPIDLMLVRRMTLERMTADSRPMEIRSRSFPIPSLAHLLALKLHALKHTHRHRTIKDFQDVVGLVQANRLDLDSIAVRQIFERYGTLEWYEKVRRTCE